MFYDHTTDYRIRHRVVRYLDSVQPDEIQPGEIPVANTDANTTAVNPGAENNPRAERNSGADPNESDTKTASANDACDKSTESNARARNANAGETDSDVRTDSAQARRGADTGTAETDAYAGAAA